MEVILYLKVLIYCLIIFDLLSYHNCKRGNQVVLLMITNDKQSDEIDQWHYIALKSVQTDDGFNHLIKSLSRLFRGITSRFSRRFLLFGLFIFILNR